MKQEINYVYSKDPPCVHSPPTCTCTKHVL